MHIILLQLKQPVLLKQTHQAMPGPFGELLRSTLWVWIWEKETWPPCMVDENSVALKYMKLQEQIQLVQDHADEGVEGSWSGEA